MKPKRAALYVRVSTDGQTTQNQRLALEAVAERRGWPVAKVYEDAGISGAKGRDKRPAFDTMLKDALRRRFDVLMVWSIDRLGRSTATVAVALAELEAAGVAIYADQQGMDATTPHGKAMLHMAAVFAELERGIIRERVLAGLSRARAQGKALGRPKVAGEVENQIRTRLATGAGIVKVARELGVGVSTVQRVQRELAEKTAVHRPRQAVARGNPSPSNQATNAQPRTDSAPHFGGLRRLQSPSLSASG